MLSFLLLNKDIGQAALVVVVIAMVMAMLGITGCVDGVHVQDLRNTDTEKSPAAGGGDSLNGVRRGKVTIIHRPGT